MSVEKRQQGHQDLSQKKNQVIIFIGPEGSGKSTQARLLAESKALPYISTGDMIRERAKNDQGQIGKACRDMFDQHTYLDPCLVKQITIDRLIRDDLKEGFVFDGALRGLDEVASYPDIFENAGHKNDTVTVVSLRLPVWESVHRLQQRRREDDVDEGILRRLGSFYDKLGERTSQMRQQWGFTQISTFGKTIKGVHEEVLGKIKEV